MNKRRVFILSAIAAVGIAGSVEIFNGIDAVAGPLRSHQGARPLALICQGKAGNRLDTMTTRLTNRLNLTTDQQQNLADVVQTLKASNLKEFCPQPGEAPKTPPERLDKAEAAMTRGLETIQNLKTPVTTFYESLSTSQQEDLNELIQRRRRGAFSGWRR